MEKDRKFTKENLKRTIILALIGVALIALAVLLVVFFPSFEFFRGVLLFIVGIGTLGYAVIILERKSISAM